MWVIGVLTSLLQRATLAESEVHSLKEQLENFKVQSTTTTSSSSSKENNNNTDNANNNNNTDDSVNGNGAAATAAKTENSDSSAPEGHNVVDSSESVTANHTGEKKSPAHGGDKETPDQVRSLGH